MRVVAVLVACLGLVACTSSSVHPGGSPSAPPTTAAHPSSPDPTGGSPGATTRPPASGPATGSAPTGSATGSTAAAAQRVFDRMSERQRVGQLLMVDCPSTGVSSATEAAIEQYHVGSVILDGTSYAGLAETRAVTAQLRRLAPKDAGLFMATDQEGGEVQRLQGPGFTRIVSGVAQGEIPPSTLQGYATGWGAELRQAGVNVNLAPVLDTVPAGFGANPPIGDLEREYGHTPSAVTAHGLAVARGLTAAGIDVTVKHFPGLGRVHGNTDLTSGVTDTVTTRHDAYLAPFRAAVDAGVPFVMMSTAVYSRIDPDRPAAFSPTIVTGMLRGDLGFRGLVISDDVGAAKQVSGYSPGERAVAFVAAGGDVVLTVDASQAAEMTGALLQKATSSAAFKKQVDAAARLVLQAKAARGLL